MEKLDFNYEIDTASDPPMFRIVDDFITQVNFALGRLKRQQLSVSGHQPRQLTPVSIMQLKRDDYQNLMEENEQGELS
jgi:hypothetical protein